MPKKALPLIFSLSLNGLYLSDRLEDLIPLLPQAEFEIIPKKTPCLNCVYPEDNNEWEELGFPVLGAVSGMLGCLMAIEAIKLLTGYGKPLLSNMLVFNTVDMEFRKLNIYRDKVAVYAVKRLNYLLLIMRY